ncbi:MAG: hypothetical protein ACREUM_08395 [Nitrosospira sp.]
MNDRPFSRRGGAGYYLEVATGSATPPPGWDTVQAKTRLAGVARELHGADADVISVNSRASTTREP